MDRFTRSRILFKEKFEVLQNLRVLVCGCGGVGGACADTLFRSGVVNLTLIDADKFDVTNQNRQIGSEFVGEEKAEVLARIFDNKPTARVLRLDATSIAQLDFCEFDFVVDAIDDIEAKILLATSFAKSGAKGVFVASMGAARRLDAQQIRLLSVWKTQNDPFARKYRTGLRKAGFKGDFKVVCSLEAPLACEGLGSFKAVTAAFGLNLASFVVQTALTKEWIELQKSNLKGANADDKI